MLEKQRLDVAGEMVDGDERKAPRFSERLGEGDADEQRSDESRPLRNGDRVEARQRGTRLFERSLDDAADIAHVLP